MEHKDSNSGFSDEALGIISDTNYILRKNRLIQSITGMMVDLESKINDPEVQRMLPNILQGRRGKISKGEQYEGMPWVALDAPAYFDKKSIFAFRHIFIWGHSFSSNLHLSGRFLDSVNLDALTQLKGNGWWVLTGQNPFVHHYVPELHIPLHQLNDSLVSQQGYLKLVQFTSFENHRMFEVNSLEFLKTVLTSGLIRNL